MHFFISTFLLALAALPSALAHFTLDYPPTRGFDEDKEPEFCGGFSTPSSIRTPFPLSSSGSIKITSHHTLSTIVTLISLEANPTSFYQFSNGSSSLPFVKSAFQVPEGPTCYEVDLGVSLSSLNIANGTLATLQIQFSGGDGNLFQCTDVVLVKDFTTPAVNMCNGTSTSSAAVGSASAKVSSTVTAAGTGVAASSAAASKAPISNAAPRSQQMGANFVLAAAAAAVVVGGMVA